MNTRSCKRRNIEILPKGLIHAIFSCFSFRNVDQENLFYDILERENAVVAYKNKKLKESKN